MISRIERTRYANWWWTVDRMMLAAIAVLMMTGIVLSLAASPAVTLARNSGLRSFRSALISGFPPEIDRNDPLIIGLFCAI